MTGIGELLDRAVSGAVRRALVVEIVGLPLVAVPALAVVLSFMITRSLPLYFALIAIQIVVTAPAVGALVWIESPLRGETATAGRAFARGCRVSPNIFVLFFPYAFAAIATIAILFGPGFAFLVFADRGLDAAARLGALALLFVPSAVAFVALMPTFTLTFCSAASAIAFEGAGPWAAVATGTRRIFARGNRRRSLVVAICAVAPQLLLLPVSIAASHFGRSTTAAALDAAYYVLSLQINGYFVALALEYDADLRRHREGLDLEAAIAGIA